MTLHHLCVSFRDYLSPSDIIGSYPHLVITGTGLAFGFLVVRHRCSLSLSIYICIVVSIYESCLNWNAFIVPSSF